MTNWLSSTPRLWDDAADRTLALQPGQPSAGAGFLGQLGGGTFPSEPPGHEGDGHPGDQGIGVLDEPFVVPRVAAGVHHPGKRPLDAPAAEQHDEAGGVLETADRLGRELEVLFRPVDELSGVGGVGPHDRDLGVHQAEPEEDFLGRSGVVEVGGQGPGRGTDGRRDRLAAHQADSFVGGGKLVNGRKRHIVIGTLGLLLGVMVTAADVEGRAAAQALLAQVADAHHRLSLIRADGGCTGGLVEYCLAALAPVIAIVKCRDDMRGSERQTSRAEASTAASASAAVLFAEPRNRFDLAFGPGEPSGHGTGGVMPAGSDHIVRCARRGLGLVAAPGPATRFRSR